MTPARRKRTRAWPGASTPSPAASSGTQNQEPRTVMALAVIAGFALVVRLIYLWQIRDAPFFTLLMGDSKGYDEWARRIAAGDWIGSDVFYQAPLYPYFMGA